MKDISPDRSIRNIEVNHRHPNHIAARPVAPPTRKRRRRTGRIWLMALIVIIIAAALGVLLSALFAGASVTIVPKEAQVALPQTMQAALNAPVGTLAYQAGSVTLTATTTVSANGTQQVNTPASGVLTVTNAYSASPQKLIANTRFEAPDGKIYRIHDAVTVPGMQGSTAGSVTVTAYADNPGPDYNRNGTTTYTIPGFAGDPRATKITATSGAMTGGFTGTQPAVAQSDLTAAKTQMEQQLDSAVRSQLAQSVPEGYELIQGTIAVSYGTLSQTDAGNGKAALSEPATASGAVIRTDDLAAAVAKQTVQGYNGEAVTFAGDAPQPTASSTGQGSLTLTLSGNATLTWVIDANALKTALVGQPKSKFEDVIKGLGSAVAKADASIRPFWASTFPSDPTKISVNVSEPK